MVTPPVPQLSKPLDLTEAKSLVDELNRFTADTARNYGATPAECSDALAVIADLRAWLTDLADRRVRRVQLHE